MRLARFSVGLVVASCFDEVPPPLPLPPSNLTQGFYGEEWLGGWDRRVAIAQAEQRRSRDVQPGNQPVVNALMAVAWLSEWHCENEERLGNLGEAGKWVCEAYKLADREDCLVYSLGCGNMFDFETAILKVAPQCEIHVFDHTLKKFEAGRVKSPNIKFNPIGLGKTNIDIPKVAKILPELRSRLQNESPVDDIEIPRNTDARTPGIRTSRSKLTAKQGSGLARPLSLGVASLVDIVTLLGHEGRTIDILKVDIEAAEYPGLIPLFENPKAFSQLPLIRQIQIEMHGMVEETHQLLLAFEARGYVIFHREINYYSAEHVLEIALVRLRGNEGDEVARPGSAAAKKQQNGGGVAGGKS